MKIFNPRIICVIKLTDRINKRLKVLVRGKQYEIKFEEKEYMDSGSCYNREGTPELHMKEDFHNKLEKGTDICKECTRESSSLVSSKDKIGSNNSEFSKDNGIELVVGSSELAMTLADSNAVRENLNIGEVKSMDTMIPKSILSDSLANNGSTNNGFQSMDNMENQWVLRDKVAGKDIDEDASNKATEKNITMQNKDDIIVMR